MDDWKTDSAITIYTRRSEKDYLIMAIREMSRQYNEKTSGQEIVWKRCHKEWPGYLGPWKNPTSTPKDNVDLLRKKFEFLKKNVPPDKFTEDQKKCFELYGNKQMDELSDLLNFINIREQLKAIRKFMSSRNSTSPSVHSQEIMEVKTEIRQLCSNEPFYETSLKRKGSAATQEPVKKKRDYSSAFPLSEELNLSHLHFRPILPKETATTSEPEDHLASGITKSVDHPSVSLSVQDNQGIIPVSSSNCPASQPNVNNTNIAGSLLSLASATPIFCLPVQDNYMYEFTSSSPELPLATPSASTPAESLSMQVHQQGLVSLSDQSFSPSDKSSQFLSAENRGPSNSFSSEEPSRSIDSGRYSLDTEDECAGYELLSPKDTSSSDWDWFYHADQSIQDWHENQQCPAPLDINSPPPNDDDLNNIVEKL